MKAVLSALALSMAVAAMGATSALADEPISYTGPVTLDTGRTTQGKVLVSPSSPLPVTLAASGSGSVTLGAGEAHIGEVGGNVILITQNPTTSSSPAYTSGDVIGSKLTFANVARVDGGTGLIQEVTLAFKSSQTAPVDFFFCGSDPSATTFTDNAAVSVAAADYNKCRVIHITDCASMGTPSVCVAGNLAFPFDLASGTTGYGFLVTRGTPTLGSTSDVEVQLRVLRN